MKDKLWYKRPLDNWMEGLPIGNGRLAGMLCTTEKEDVLYLNHEWLWRGKNRSRDNAPAYHMLDETRSLLKNGDFYRATLLANTYFGGASGGISGLPTRVDSYQPAGELKFQFKNAKAFSTSSLNIFDGVAETERKTENSNVNATYIAHQTYGNIICHYEGDVNGSLSFERIFDKEAIEKYYVTDKKIVYNCRFEGGIEFAVEIEYVTDGILNVKNKGVEVFGATYLTAFVNIATEVKGIENELKKFRPPTSETWKKILELHKVEFSKIINRFTFDIACEPCDIPTDERIENYKSGSKDNELILLYYNYGRYLLVSTSFGAELPANLQGKWNDEINPPWECDYHFDINLQMNYWMAEQVNLSECVEPLISYCESFIPHGRKAAMDLYGCRGIYIPLSADAWGRSTVDHLGWGVWIGAAPWLAQHFWSHYIYSLDNDFLKNHAYKFFKEIAIFYEDYLVKDENGIYQIMPSQSPENRFEGTGSLFEVSIGISSSMDVQLAYDLLGYAINSAKILNVDKDRVRAWNELRQNLPSFKIGSDGRLLEWDCERKEVQKGHRHLSHLYGVYPSDIFNVQERPNEYFAAKKSFEYRISHGGGYTGWSRAWCACLCARFGEKEKVYEHITEMISEFATSSLLDLHPPRIFQVDGNFGAVAAMTEAVAQFVGGKLWLLRALPDEWSKGNIKNLRVPGGHTVSFEWKNSNVVALNVCIGKGEKLIIIVNGKKLTVNGFCGENKSFSYNDIVNCKENFLCGTDLKG